MLQEILLTSSLLSSPEQFNCLAKNSYFEARNQSDIGIIAVAQVVVNRVHSSQYPNTICEVVKEGIKTSTGAMKRDACQFSWYCDGLSDHPKEELTWEHAQKVTLDALVLHESGFDLVDGSLWYHAKTVSPYWASAYNIVVQIDDHIFYNNH